VPIDVRNSAVPAETPLSLHSKDQMFPDPESTRADYPHGSLSISLPVLRIFFCFAVGPAARDRPRPESTYFRLCPDFASWFARRRAKLIRNPSLAEIMSRQTGSIIDNVSKTSKEVFHFDRRGFV
jgi:hypothetical protein